MITLAAGRLEAGFAPEVGMVCHSLRHDGEELLTQRDGVEGYVRTGRWMGVPLLYPWANRLAAWDYEALGRSVDLAPLADDVVVRDRKTGLPIHGVLPPEWAVLEAGPDRIAAELAGDGPAFPFPHRMRIDAELSPTTLRIATTLEALEGEVPVAFGFHPWFDAPRADGIVELPEMRRLVLRGLLPTGETAAAPAYSGPLAALDLDDGYEGVADGAVFSVAGGGRRIELRLEAGYPCAQVFAPPDKDVICFEPMTAPADALRSGSFAVAAPGRPYRAAFTIAVDAG
ncbi:MAG TPA: aldose 1-epimerase [Solirubrobacteraceae bacterium]|nr:aldose 1-epimerase [Solirubrobacteraceae bacterium]